MLERNSFLEVLPQFKIYKDKDRRLKVYYFKKMQQN